MGDVEEVATQDRPEGAEEEGAARRHREEREMNVDLVDDVVEGPRVEAFVELAHRPRRCSQCSCDICGLI